METMLELLMEISMGLGTEKGWEISSVLPWDAKEVVLTALSTVAKMESLLAGRMGKKRGAKLAS